MTLNRRNAKRDANEPEIVDYLRARGCSVIRQDKPCDLLIGYRGKNILAEVKMPKGKFTEDQKKFAQTWQGDPPWPLRTIQDATEMLEAFDG